MGPLFNMTHESVSLAQQGQTALTADVMNKKDFIRNLLFDKTEDNSEESQNIFNDQLKSHIADLTEKLTQSNDCLSEDWRLESMFRLSSTQVKNTEQFNNLISLIDPLFDQLVIESALCSTIKHVINKLRLPYLIYLSVNPKILLDKQNPAKHLINDLISIGLLWNQKDPRGEQLFQQIKMVVEQLVSACLDSEKFPSVFKQSEEHFAQFASTITKRVEIFEKRVREAEEGQAKAQSAKIWTNQALSQVINKQGIPSFINQMLSTAWQHVIFLEFLKSGNKEENKSLFTAKALLCSLQEIHTFEETEKFLELQPVLVDTLKSGLEKSSYTFAETQAFLEELDSLHDKILADVKKALEKGPKEEILRLKPVENPFESFDQPVEEEPEHTDIENLSVHEWVEHVFSKLEDAANQDAVIEDSPKTRREKDRSVSEKLFRSLQPGRWLEIKTQNEVIRCKLSLYLEANDKYVFVNGAGAKVAEYDGEELISAYQDKNVVILKNTPLFERAFKSVLNDLYEQHSEAVEASKIESNVTPATRQGSQASMKNEPADQVTDILETEISESTPEQSLDRIESEFDIALLSKMAVGSWVEIRVGYKMKKCRLAAKIASTGKLIFTDRSGIKVKECIDSELESLYKKGDLVIDQEHTLFDKAFSSVISNMRNLKSDKP